MDWLCRSGKNINIFKTREIGRGENKIEKFKTAFKPKTTVKNMKINILLKPKDPSNYKKQNQFSITNMNVSTEINRLISNRTLKKNQIVKEYCLVSPVAITVEKRGWPKSLWIR